MIKLSKELSTNYPNLIPPDWELESPLCRLTVQPCHDETSLFSGMVTSKSVGQKTIIYEYSGLRHSSCQECDIPTKSTS